MPNWRNLLVAAGLFGFGTYTFINHGSVWTGALACAAGLYVLAISVLGLSSGAGADLQEAIKFVRNPKDAILDRAIADLGGAEEPGPSATEAVFGRVASLFENQHDEPPKQFDPDAAFARYMATRPPGGPAEEQSAPAARPSFGRKGV